MAVTVTNPAPGGGTSNAVNFTIGASNPFPTITTISPASALAGSPGFTLTVNGTNFVAASLITFGATTHTPTFVNSTQLTASIDAAAIAGPGTMTVTVTNPAPGGGTSNPVDFTISGPPNPVPAINSISPNIATVGGPAFTLTVPDVRGDPSFADVPGSVIRWNGADRPTAPSGNIFGLTAQIPASDIATAGTAAVTVFNPPPGGGVSNSLTFTIAPGGVSPVSVATAPDATGKFGKFAYVANALTNNISMYAIDPTTGALTSQGRIAAGTLPYSTAVDPSGKFAYVTNSGSNDVSMYAINPINGALTPIGVGTIPAGTSPVSVAVDPSGKFAYVANSGSNDISMYSIDAVTGALTLIGTIGT